MRADPTPSSTVRIVAANTAWRLMAYVARAAGALAATILVGRLRGPSSLGLYQFAFAITLLLSFAVALGLPKLLVREIARRPEEAKPWLEAAVFAVLVSGVAMTALIVLGASAFNASPELVAMLTLAGPALTFDAAARVLFSVFWSRELMRLEAVATLIQEAAFVVGTLAVLRTGYGVAGVMAAYMVSRAVGAGAAWILASRLLAAPLIPRPHRSLLIPTLRRTIPFAADDALSLAYIRVDVVLLGFFKGPRAVGLYQAGANLVIYLNVLPRMLNFALYARMSRAWPSNPRQLGRLRDASLLLIGALGVPLMVGTILLAPRIIRVVYGSAFGEAVLSYQVLALLIPIRMLGHTLGTTLTAADGQTQRTYAVAGAAIGNVALNLVVIPRWSFLGAAITSVITEAGLFIAYLVLLHRKVGSSRTQAAVGTPALACVPLAAAVLLTPGAPLAVTVASGIVAYATGLLAIALIRAPTGGGPRPRAALASFVRGVLG
jgi:O-antigen/teichoic acid export membrane protein